VSTFGTDAKLASREFGGLAEDPDSSDDVSDASGGSSAAG
jgi:hypothetical protein